MDRRRDGARHSGGSHEGKTEALMRISILGMDYRSVVVAGCLSFRGHRVIGFDPSPRRADWLNRHGEHAAEAGLDALLEQGWQAGLLSGTTDLCAAVRETEVSFLDGSGEAWPAADTEVRCRGFGEALRDKREDHRLLVRSNQPREKVIARLLPILESSSGKRLGRGFQLEVSQDYLGERNAGQ